MTIEYGRRAAIRPSDTSETELYECPANGSFIGRLTVCNQASSLNTYRVAHTNSSGTASGNDWLRYDAELMANDFHTIDVELDSGDTLRVQAGSGDTISFILSGALKS